MQIIRTSSALISSRTFKVERQNEINTKRFRFAVPSPSLMRAAAAAGLALAVGSAAALLLYMLRRRRQAGGVAQAPKRQPR